MQTADCLHDARGLLQRGESSTDLVLDLGLEVVEEAASVESMDWTGREPTGKFVGSTVVDEHKDTAGCRSGEGELDQLDAGHCREGKKWWQWEPSDEQYPDFQGNK